MPGWDNFFLAEIGAAAALAGLIFVGISINLTKILALPGLPGRTAEALIILLNILLISSLLLVPGQSVTAIGLEILILGLAVWIANLVFQIRSLRVGEPRFRGFVWLRVALGALACGPFVIAGIVLLAQDAGGIYWTVPGVLFSFAVALFDAWVLLIGINR